MTAGTKTMTRGGPVVAPGDRHAGDTLLRFWQGFLEEAKPRLPVRDRVQMEAYLPNLAQSYAGHSTDWLFKRAGFQQNPFWLAPTVSALCGITTVLGFDQVDKLLKARGHLP